MTAYLYRVIGIDGSPTGWTGLAVAPSLQELFWAIDEFVDPHSVEVQTVSTGSVILDGFDNGNIAAETSELIDALLTDGKWRSPKWEKQWERQDETGNP